MDYLLDDSILLVVKAELRNSLTKTNAEFVLLCFWSPCDDLRTIESFDGLLLKSMMGRRF